MNTSTCISISNINLEEFMKAFQEQNIQPSDYKYWSFELDSSCCYYESDTPSMVLYHYPPKK